jgi:hypothetical protein
MPGASWNPFKVVNNIAKHFVAFIQGRSYSAGQYAGSEDPQQSARFIAEGPRLSVKELSAGVEIVTNSKACAPTQTQQWLPARSHPYRAAIAAIC